MFSKNIKILSLFLILAVVMIGALGAVSAQPASTDATTNATINGEATVVQNSSDLHSANATISGTIETSVISNDTHVAIGTPVNSSSSGGAANPAYTATITTDQNASNVVSGVSSVEGITLNENGSFNKNITFTGTDYLVNGQTYYICLTNTTQQYAFDDSGNYALVNNTNYFIEFDYKSAALTLENNQSTVNYGDAWTFSGKVTDINGVDLYQAPVTVKVGNNGPITVYTDKFGSFFVNNTMFNSGDPLNAGTYAIVFNSTNTGNAANATLNITKKKLVVVANLNETSINYGDTVNLTVTLQDANGKVYNSTMTLVYSTMNATATPTIDLTGVVTLADGTNSVAPLAANVAPGTYWMTVTNNSEEANFDITPAALTLTINTVSTTLTPSADEFVVPSGTTEKWGNFTLATAKENLTGKTVNVILYKADGTPLASGTATSAGNVVYTIDNSTFSPVSSTLANGKYYIKANYAGVSGYAASNATVDLTIKGQNTITSNGTIAYTYGTTGNTTIVNVTSSPVANTTLNVYVDDQNTSAGTVTITDGNGTFNLGNLDLPAGTHTVTFKYAGDDSNAPASSVTTVTVNPVVIGKLYINGTSTIAVTVNLTSEDTVVINLTNISNKKQLIDYTGNLAYFIGTTEKGNISMVNGVATVKVADLKGLNASGATYKFAIDDDVASSNSVTLTVTTTTLNTKIVADNVTTNDAAPIVITGTVANATEGTISVALIKNGTTVATTTTTVAADGTFTATFGNFPNGNYTANVTYNSTTGLSKNTTTNVSVIVNGTAPTPVSGNITTVLTINNFTNVVNAGQNLTGKLTDVNGNPIVGHHVLLNLSRNGSWSNKTYWVTTDLNGEFQLPINLAVGSYSVIANYYGLTVGNATYLPSGPVTASITVNNGTEPVDNRTAVVLTANNFTSNVTGQNFTGTLFANGTPLVGHQVVLKLVNAKTGANKVYYANVDLEGGFQLEINLHPGNFYIEASYAGTSVYQPAAANATVVRT